MSRLGPLFTRPEPHRSCREYLHALVADLPRVNCWTLAEYAGHTGPDRTQYLLERASGDTTAALAAVRGFVVEQLAGEDAVLVFDQSGEEKAGSHTVRVVDRQYAGTAGKVTNCVNAVYCTYASRIGHALCQVRLYLPEAWAHDPAPPAAGWRSKAGGIRDQAGPGTRDAGRTPGRRHPAPVGSSRCRLRSRRHFRAAIEAAGRGYVLQVPCDFRIRLGCGARIRADQTAKLIADQPWPNLYSAGLGNKGELLHRWGWIGTEEDLKHGKQHAALADSQVRTWTAWHRHQLLSIAALAIKAVAAAHTTDHTTPPPLPQIPDQQPPADLAPIPLTIPEIAASTRSSPGSGGLQATTYIGPCGGVATRLAPAGTTIAHASLSSFHHDQVTIYGRTIRLYAHRWR